MSNYIKDTRDGCLLLNVSCTGVMKTGSCPIHGKSDAEHTLVTSHNALLRVKEGE